MCIQYCVTVNFAWRRIHQFGHLLSLVKYFLQNFFSCVNDYIEEMALQRHRNGGGAMAPPQPQQIGGHAREQKIYNLITDIYIRPDYEPFNETSWIASYNSKLWLTYCLFFCQETLAYLSQQPRSCQNGRDSSLKWAWSNISAHFARDYIILAPPSFIIFLRLCSTALAKFISAKILGYTVDINLSSSYLQLN